MSAKNLFLFFLFSVSIINISSAQEKDFNFGILFEYQNADTPVGIKESAVYTEINNKNWQAPGLGILGEYFINDQIGLGVQSKIIFTEANYHIDLVNSEPSIIKYERVDLQFPIY